MLTDDVQQAMFQAMKARRTDEVAALRRWDPRGWFLRER